MKTEPNDICSGHLQRYQNCRPCSLQSSSKNVSIFDEGEQSICRNHRRKVNRGAGYGLEVICVYMDKMKELVESLLADGHYNLCNSDFAQ